MSYKAALHHANQVLGLAGKASKYIKELFDAPDVSFLYVNSQSLTCKAKTRFKNSPFWYRLKEEFDHCYWIVYFFQNEVESIRLRTNDYEMIIAQQGNFTVIVTQEKDPSALKVDPRGALSEEKKEEAEKKETVWDASIINECFLCVGNFHPCKFLCANILVWIFSISFMWVELRISIAVVRCNPTVCVMYGPLSRK